MTIVIGRVAKTKAHSFADTLEILCAFDGQSPYSETDAYSLISTAAQTADEAPQVDDPDVDDNGIVDGEDGAEINARLQGYVDECYRQLAFRIQAFGESYPFSLEKNLLTLKSPLTVSQKVYLVLLAASRSRSFSGEGFKGFPQRIADLFEFISRDAMINLLPGGASVVMFGPNAQDRKDNFDSDLRKALPVLSKFMGMRLTEGWNGELKAQGDVGLDLIGVQPLDEFQGGWNVFIGQCAAQEDEATWQKKRAEARIDFFSWLFSSSVPSQAVLFIPVCYRQPDGTWANRRHCDAVIMIDRLRFIHILDSGVPSAAMAEEFLRQHNLINDGEQLAAA